MRLLIALGMLCLALFTSGCTADGSRKGPPLPLNAPKGLKALSAQQTADLQPVITFYLDHRKQAVIAGDVGILHSTYPELKEGTDHGAGINAEPDMIASNKGLEILDGSITPEHYAPLLVRQDGDRAVVLVNGMEMYRRKNNQESGGQFQLLLFLERRGAVWTVVRTDETTLAEYKQALQSR